MDDTLYTYTHICIYIIYNDFVTSNHVGNNNLYSPTDASVQKNGSLLSRSFWFNQFSECRIMKLLGPCWFPLRCPYSLPRMGLPMLCSAHLVNILSRIHLIIVLCHIVIIIDTKTSENRSEK